MHIREGTNGRWRTLITCTRPRNEKFHHNVCGSSDIIAEIETRGEFYDVLAHLRVMINTYAVSVRRPERRRTFRGPKRKSGNIKFNLQAVLCDDMNCIEPVPSEA